MIEFTLWVGPVHHLFIHLYLAMCVRSCAPQGSSVVLWTHSVHTVEGGVSRAWLQWHLRSDHGERKWYTNAEKLALSRKASLPGCNIASVAQDEGLPQSTMQSFIKNIQKQEENSTVENNLKAIQKDKTPMITKALILFCERARRVFLLKQKILLLNCK